jgi:hypothetical protein
MVDIVAAQPRRLTHLTPHIIMTNTTAIEAYGVKGLKSTLWRKTFKSQAAFQKWLEKNEGNVEVHGISQL